MQTEASLTAGPLTGKIIRFSLPLVLSNLLQVLFNMADVAVVGRFAGAEALGSVGSTTILVSLYTGFLFGTGSGINVLTARYIGARSESDIQSTVHTAAILSLIIGIIELAIGQISNRAVLELLGTKEELIDGAALYLRIYYVGLPAMAVFNFGNAVLSANGDTRHPLYILSAAGALNIALNLLFVIGFGMDVAGVAIASVISQCLAATLVIAFVIRRGDAVAFRLRDIRFNREKARFLITLGIPSGLQNSTFALANLFIQSGVNSFPAVVVEGSSAAANADPLVYDVMAAFYTACSSFMSQNLGAREPVRVMRSYYTCLSLSFGVALALSSLLLLFGEGFLSVFTTEPAVIAAGMDRLRVMACSYAFSAFMDCTIAASRGIGRSMTPMVIVMLGSCLFRIIWIFTVFAYFHTITSLYLLYIFSWSITGVAEYIYFRRAWREVSSSL